MPEIQCPKCGNKRYLVEGGVKKACACTKFLRLSVYAPDMVPALKLITVPEFEQLSTTEFTPNCHVTIKSPSEDYVRVLQLFYLVERGLATYKIFNVYELIEIFLGHHTQYTSIFHLRMPAVILTEGYHEFPNKRQNDIILQFLNQSRSQGNSVLFISRKNETDLSLRQFMEANHWKFLVLPTATKGTYARL